MGLKAETYCGDTGFAGYDVIDKKSLNFFDVVKNSNKFYTIEIHEFGGKFRIFTDYGRLGITSKKEVRYPSSKYEAEREFERIVSEKKKKGYVEVELAQSTTGSQKAKELIDATHIKANINTSVVKSNLDPIIQGFVKQIFEEAGQKLNQFVKGSANSDGASPLGKLSERQIRKGRDILSEIATLMGNAKEDTILNLSQEFYRYIPKSFGRVVSSNRIIINTSEKLMQEMDMLKFYEDSLRMGSIIFDNSDIDKQYESLHSDIGVLDPGSEKYKQLVHYVTSTESQHHGVHLHVKRIFTVNQHNAPKFDNSPGNVRELFHGSRSANLPGILSSYLKLPSQLKGVYITGAMFGPGIYFADQSTKSSQYSCSRFGGTSNKFDSAFMFVADVALGKIKKEENSSYYSVAPAGYHSVMGVAGRSLLHNEYITYKENQQQLKYIIEFAASRR